MGGRRRGTRRLGLLITGVVAAALFATPAHADHTYQLGDVFVSVGNGRVEWYSRVSENDYVLHQVLQGPPSVFTTGSAFDKFKNFYLTGFDNDTISKFNEFGVFTGVFAMGDPLSHVESLNITRSTNNTGTSFAVYAGQADGTKDILKFNEAGMLVERYDVVTQDRGSDWIDLATDLCTMFYTSEGPSILRYDVCNKVQLPSFTDDGFIHYALRIRPGGEVIAANSIDIRRYNSDGTLAQTYDVPLHDCWFSLNLDPDDKSFWSADFCNGKVHKFDVATGDVLFTIDTGLTIDLGGFLVHGLSVFGEKTASGNQPTCEAKITDAGTGRVLITQARATFGGNAAIDKNGQPVGQEQYQDHALAMNFHSTGITDVECTSEGQAEVTGTGTVKLTGMPETPVNFKIQLEDNGEPGVGKDVYEITLTGGFVYESGKMVLEGGNVQVHRTQSGKSS